MPRYHQQRTAVVVKTVAEVVMETPTFTCSICGETSHRICVYCTKDACANHLCERCLRCSDCCECEFKRLAEDHTAETTPHQLAREVAVQNGDITDVPA